MSESLDKVFVNSSSGLSAESIRMNTIASNLANSGSIGSSDATTYHKKYPIFSEVVKEIHGLNKDEQPIGGVQVTDIKNTSKPLSHRYEPNNPMADDKGYVYMTDVNPIEEMTDMISASREYEANVEMMNTTKNLVMQSINLLKE